MVGTSSGAFAGSLYAAGYTPEEVARELSRVPPIRLLRVNPRVWEGFFLLDGVVERLRELLPPTFEDLPTDFAVGVVDRHGRHHLVDSGPLPEAVAASACVPLVFKAVAIPGREQGPFVDGGKADRMAVVPHRERRRGQLAGRAAPPPALVHLISRSSPFSGGDAIDRCGERDLHVVRSGKVRFREANLWDLGDFSGMMARSRSKAVPAVSAVAAPLRGRAPLA